MKPADRYLDPSEAASRLGVSTKALRLYEQRGLLTPARTRAGWRAYGPAEMARAAEIVALRGLGLSLGRVARVLAGDGAALASALDAHRIDLESRVHDLAAALDKVRRLREDLAGGATPAAGTIAALTAASRGPTIAFDLPWPWGGERFEWADVRPLTHIVGPLGSGKTRLARSIAAAVAGAVFVGLDRLDGDGAAAKTVLSADPARATEVEAMVGWLIEDGATVSDALIALLTALTDPAPTLVVVDMLEQGLDKATQEALIALLRRRAPSARPLFFLTRSNVVLDLEAVGPHETILFCPPNHSPPFRVAPFRGAPGYEAVETCLATPEVRARTEGTIAVRPARA